MTECNGCGSCCDPVVMPYSLEYARRHPEEFPAENLRWILEDLTPISRHQAKSKEPDFVRSLAKLEPLIGGRLAQHYFSCRHFDAETRQCSNYDQRPPICRGYPWLAGVPIAGTPLPPTCSFRADIGLPVAVRITPKP